jgi:hypothetical protein
LSDAPATGADPELNGNLPATRVWRSDAWKLPLQSTAGSASVAPSPSAGPAADGSDADASSSGRLRGEGERAEGQVSVAAVDSSPAAAIPTKAGKGSRWGRFWTALVTGGGLGVLAVGVAACLAMWSDWRGAEGTRVTASRESPLGRAPASTAAAWTDASRFSQRLGHAEVKVLRAFHGPIRVRDMNNQVVVTRDENLLAVTVSVRNLGPRPYPFFNWYVNVFEEGSGDPVAAELTDDHARQYALLRFDDASSVEGQRWAARIEPRDRVQDTVVFLVPDEVARGEIAYFRLSLPAAAVGLAGSFRFQIPVTMIEGF